MKRVVIIGCPGAGKTTFSRRLSEKTGLPVIHLDFYYHQLEYDYYHNKEAWVKKVIQLIKKDSWIMDGNYKSSFGPRLKRADTIIFFDFPRKLTLYRTLKRRFVYRNKHREEMPLDWKEKANREFLKYVWNFNRDSRPLILDALKPAKEKNVVIFKFPNEVEQYLKML